MRGRGTLACRQPSLSSVLERNAWSNRALWVRRMYMDTMRKLALLEEGLQAFNSAHFYDAHEHWEEVWLETPNPEKRFLQGLIQIAAAFHHFSRANPQGTKNLLHAGLLKLQACPDAQWGLEIEPLRIAVRDWLSALASVEVPVTLLPPKISRHPPRRRG